MEPTEPHLDPPLILVISNEASVYGAFFEKITILHLQLPMMNNSQSKRLCKYSFCVKM